MWMLSTPRPFSTVQRTNSRRAATYFLPRAAFFAVFLAAFFAAFFALPAFFAGFLAIFAAFFAAFFGAGLAFFAAFAGFADFAFAGAFAFAAGVGDVATDFAFAAGGVAAGGQQGPAAALAARALGAGGGAPNTTSSSSSVTAASSVRSAVPRPRQATPLPLVPQVAALLTGSPAALFLVIVVVEGSSTVPSVLRFLVVGELQGLVDFLVTRHACLLKQ
jgi:hypothetical protein